MTEVHFWRLHAFCSKNEPNDVNIECFILLIHTRKLHGDELYESVLKMKTLLESHGNIG